VGCTENSRMSGASGESVGEAWLTADGEGHPGRGRATGGESWTDQEQRLVKVRIFAGDVVRCRSAERPPEAAMRRWLLGCPHQRVPGPSAFRRF